MRRSVNELKDRLDAIMGVKKAEQKPDVDTAFWNMVHIGKVQNALKENSDGSGGYLVPDSYDTQLVDALREKIVLRRISRVIKTEHTLRIPVTDTTGEAQWIDEEHPFHERYADKGRIGFQMHERVDAKLIRPEAMCCLKIKEESE